jgi:hypothetical protein
MANNDKPIPWFGESTAADNDTPIDTGLKIRAYWGRLIEVPVEPPRRDWFLEGLEHRQQAQAGAIDLMLRAASSSATPRP